MRLFVFLPVCSALIGCSGGNVHPPSYYGSAPAASVRNEAYDPTMPYGSAPAIWAPVVASRSGTVIRPADPSNGVGRPDYEHAPWMNPTGSSPMGTF